MLILHMDPAAWEALEDAAREEFVQGHRSFQRTVAEAGELVAAHTLAHVFQSTVVRVVDGTASVSDGPLLASPIQFSGFYLIDCETVQRAHELAALLPEARMAGLGIEVRPIMLPSGSEM
ncbi:YciI family protein [Streptomyces ficellus]|uniref:YciI family protein n=1 Tax=Streptomyces ficellus TaxID=1977088 RepID=A0ABT7YZZ0_9ACTN|nr:YciI family protein [Streptomyces ficellus]MDN3292792.1 YciI family protein [Streptomyces ficellus]